MPEPPARDAASRLADVVSVASDFGAIWVLLCVAQVVFGRRRLTPSVARLGAAGVTSLVITRTLKHHFAVARDVAPDVTSLARTPTSPGFPSGHTLAAFASALTVPRTSQGRTAALAFAALVAWARVKVGHHRPVDVIAGAGAGTIVGAALLETLDRLPAVRT